MAASNAMKVEVIQITPKFATELLANNNGNRKIRESTVERYAQQMRDGQWQLTAEPIMLTKSMRLLNGQHRLRAVVAAGKAIKFSVAYDVPEESFSALDRGVGRTTADALGVPNAQTAVARLSLVIGGAKPHLITDQMIGRRIETIATELDALLAFCGTARKIFSSASFKLAAVARVLNGTKRAYVHELYRHLVLGHVSELPPIAQSAIGALVATDRRADWNDSKVLLARGWIIFDPDRARNTRIQVKDPTVAAGEITAVLRKIEKAKS